MTPADAGAIRRRYHLLLVLRFVPTGLMVTVLVLLLQERGLSLAEIGLGTAAQGLVMLVLELPSGGLADALGRKPVVVVAWVLSVVSVAVLLVADSVLLVAAAFALQGVFRALDSGPLQAWFIDSLLRADPDVSVERSLGRADVVTCAAIGAGALTGGLLARSGGVLGASPLASPLLLAMVVQAAGVVAVLAYMDEVRAGHGWRAAQRAVRGVPAVTGDAVRAIRTSTLLTALVAAEALWGFGMIAFETLMPPRMAELTPSSEAAAAIVGPAVTAAWVLSALGSAAAPWLTHRYGAPRTGFALRLAHGLTVVAMGLAAGPTGLVVAYLCTYWVHGATNTVHYAMVHRAVQGAPRATVLSANSLASQLGGAIGGIALGALADAASVTTAMLAAAAVLAVAAPCYLAGSSPRPTADVLPTG